MGGKSPFIVLEDAKINDDLIDNAINSAFWNGGQNCSANMRQIVHKKVKDEFLDKVIKKVKKLKVGDPLDLKSNMGSMISKNIYKQLMDIFKKELMKELNFYLEEYQAIIKKAFMQSQLYLMV